MARLSSLDPPPPDFDAINLRRALSRLEQKILVDPHHRLRRSAFERVKTASNLEYARTLLLRLEHAAAQLKIQSRKQAQQATLIQQRALIKRLHDRLYSLNHQADDAEASDDGEVEGSALQILSSDLDDTSAVTLDRRKEADDTAIPAATMRNRHDATKTDTTTTFSSTTGADVRSALFPPSRPPPPSSTSHPTSTPESALLLSSATDDATNLTSLLVAQAAALKASSLAFGADLAADQEAVARAAALLDKSGEGMRTATKRMGLLGRMSEGRWWWGRMVLYAGIAALWVVAILLVGVAPKLRL